MTLTGYYDLWGAFSHDRCRQFIQKGLVEELKEMYLDMINL
jgi:hypothetical protein